MRTAALYRTGMGFCPGGCLLGRSPPPPVNRMTDRCKNITFPQLRLRAVKTKYWSPSVVRRTWLRALPKCPKSFNYFSHMRSDQGFFNHCQLNINKCATLQVSLLHTWNIRIFIRIFFGGGQQQFISRNIHFHFYRSSLLLYGRYDIQYECQ